MDFLNIEGLPDTEKLKQILILHEHIFSDSHLLVSKAQTKTKLLFTIGLDKDEVVGYKIGYELNSDCFYSWLGAVNENHRNKGIASKLMHQQHLYLKEKGYKSVQTKTKNSWRNMLILNIKNGFDVIGTYTDNSSDLKIIFEKSL